jgi:4a-hydroxytetrahydrobiopterin dehydratase
MCMPSENAAEDLDTRSPAELAKLDLRPLPADILRMSTLQESKCTACRADSPRATDEEIAEFKPQIPDWKIVERDGIPRLERTFRLKNFVEALELTNKVGALAEAEGHHPAVLTQWGSVTITWWTHKIRGLHRNDFIMAARTDRLAADLPVSK